MSQRDPREVDVPAVCETCGAVFPSGIVVEDGLPQNYRGNRSGPWSKRTSLGRRPGWGICDHQRPAAARPAEAGYSPAAC